MNEFDEMNELHHTLFDNDLLQIKELESKTVIGYYATLSAMIKVSKKK